MTLILFVASKVPKGIPYETNNINSFSFRRVRIHKLILNSSYEQLTPLFFSQSGATCYRVKQLNKCVRETHGPNSICGFSWGRVFCPLAKHFTYLPPRTTD